MSPFKWDCGDSGDSRAGGHGACARTLHPIKCPWAGERSALSSEQVGVPGGHLQTQNRDSCLPSMGVPLGSLRASVYPSVGMAQHSCLCSGMPGSSGAPCPHVPMPR